MNGVREMKKIGFLTAVAVTAILMMAGCSTRDAFKPSENYNKQKALLYIYLQHSLDGVGDVSEDTTVDDNRYNVYVNTYLMGQLGSKSYLPIEIPVGDISVSVKHAKVIRSGFESDVLKLAGVKRGETYYLRVSVDGRPEIENVGTQTGLEQITSTTFTSQGFDFSKLNRQISGEKLPETMPRLLVPGKANIEPTYANNHEAQPAVTPVKKTSEERLEKLFDLKEKGAITEDEYNTLKAKILAE
jgi:hypothetical protein